MLHKCFNATLLKTETEVEYFPEGGSITDYTSCIFGTNVGVSVTRAMKFRGEFDMEDAKHLLNKKLKGITQANRNTLENWHKQILHVWATSNHVANILSQAVEHIDERVLNNTVVLVTVASTTPQIFQNEKN